MSRPRVRANYDLLTPSGAAALTAGWLAVGLFAATSWWLAAGWEGLPRDFLLMARSPVVAGLCWVPITLAVFGASRRWPLSREASPRRIIGYAVAAAATTFALNGMWAVVMAALGVLDLANVATATLAMGLRWLHVNAAVFAGLVGAAHWVGGGTEHARTAASAPREFRTTLTAGSNGSRRLLPVEQVDWISGAGDYCTVHLGGDEHLVDERLKALERSLDPQLFVRIHRSTIVRVDRIAEIRPLGRGDCEVRLSTGARLRVARRRRDQLEKSLALRVEP